MIIPLLKKANLNTEDFKNFRPVSKLPFISKLIEKSVAVQLLQYLMTTTLMRNYNLFTRNCIALTETALLRVHDNILRAVDHGCTVVLLLLDLSALSTMVYYFTDLILGLVSKAKFLLSLSLISQTEASQFVSINGSNSSQSNLMFGVALRSVLLVGPILYLLYTSPLGDIIRRHDMNFHFYVDDCQVHFSFDSFHLLLLRESKPSYKILQLGCP